jgi:hypothetical protein
MDFFRGLLGFDDNPRFSRAEVANHGSRDSLWLVAGTKVYDVTQFVDQHPGGTGSLTKRAGGCTDCTRDFGFHSSRAQALWKSFYIGELAPHTDDAGRTFLRSRGITPVDEQPASSRCGGGGGATAGPDAVLSKGSATLRELSGSGVGTAGNAGKARETTGGAALPVPMSSLTPAPATAK